MKTIKVKRLLYKSILTGEIHLGATEYDGNLSDENILGSVHELGKTEWRPSLWVGPGDKWENELWLLTPDTKNPKIKYPTYRIFVETFYRYEKTWWDTFCDNIKRILRI